MKDIKGILTLFERSKKTLVNHPVICQFSAEGMVGEPLNCFVRKWN